MASRGGLDIQIQKKTVNLDIVSFISFTWCAAKEKKWNEIHKHSSKKKNNNCWAMFKTTRRTEIYAFYWGKPNKTIRYAHGKKKCNKINIIIFSLFVPFFFFCLVIYTNKSGPISINSKNKNKINRSNWKTEKYWMQTNTKPKINWFNVRVLNSNFH